MTATKWLANAVIVVALALQILPTISSWRLYPFIDYPMYSARGWPQPIEMPHMTVTIVTESGAREQFLPDSGQELSRGVSVYGLAQGVYLHRYLLPMATDCGSEKAENAAADLGQRMNRYAEDRVTLIEVDSTVHRLENDEITAAPTTTCSYEIADVQP